MQTSCFFVLYVASVIYFFSFYTYILILKSKWLTFLFLTSPVFIPLHPGLSRVIFLFLTLPRSCIFFTLLPMNFSAFKLGFKWFEEVSRKKRIIGKIWTRAAWKLCERSSSRSRHPPLQTSCLTHTRVLIGAFLYDEVVLMNIFRLNI